MRYERVCTGVAVFVGLVSGCSGNGSGSRGGTSTAPITTAPVASTIPTVPSSPVPVGTWEVKGTDPVRGAYTGTAVVSSAAPLYGVRRIVTFATRLPDGRALVQAWNATATVDSSGLHVQATLRRADFVKRLGTLQRTAADAQPLALDAAFVDATGAAPTRFGAGTKLSGTFQSRGSSSAVATETWVLTTAGTANAPPFPETSVRSMPIHGLDTKVRSAFFKLYASYHTLPAVAPYAGRPEFQDAIHRVRVDHTAKDYYQKLGGANAVVILDKVVDEISILEETQRANAFSRKLHEKAKLFDEDLRTKHVDATDFIGWIVPGTQSRRVSQDAALYQGVWVGSQVYRYVATKDPEALANVERGVKGLITLVDITPSKDEFARAIIDAASAPSGWVKGTGAFAKLAYLPGGNNDMLHGIDYGFVAAESILPAGHPLRAEIGRAARSLLANVKIAQKGTHSILLGYVAARITGDPTLQKNYESALGSQNLKDRIWMSLGDGMIQVQSITDWSGHHLAQLDMLGLPFLGGASPTSAEKSWRQASSDGARAAFNNLGACRLGLLAMIAGATRTPGASDLGKEVLEEIPYPKPSGDVDADLRITSEFCLSPYPRLPWKADWMKNPGRMQGIEGRPYFQHGPRDNYWNPATLSFESSWANELAPGQDFVHAYWYARATGQLSASD